MELFVSDLHLESPDSARFATFAAWLDRESPRATAIYVLGDLCEVWVGDDDDGPLAGALTDVLGKAATRSAIYLMHGNRDFLLGHRFSAASGVTLIDDPHQLEDGTLLAHGDAFCTDDTRYQQLRATLRSPAWQSELLARPLEARRTLAAELRSVSQRENANKPANIMDVNPVAVSACARETATTLLVHGHTHRPGVHRHSWGTRIVLGAWDRCGWAARRVEGGAGGTINLECFPLTGRYGT